MISYLDESGILACLIQVQTLYFCYVSGRKEKVSSSSEKCGGTGGIAVTWKHPL